MSIPILFSLLTIALSIAGYLYYLAIPLIITFFKKWYQVGKSWNKWTCAEVTIKGKNVICHHCNNDTFYKKEGILPTSFIALFGFTMWNRSARCFVCNECGFVNSFIYHKHMNNAEDATFVEFEDN